MKNTYLFVFSALILLFAQCSPKVKEAVQAPSYPIPTDNSFRQEAPAPGPVPDIVLGAYETFTLDNGLKVFVVENHKNPRVSWRLFVDTPPFMEGEAAGYAGIAGDLLSTGTKTRTKAEIDEAVDFVGATLITTASGVIGGSLTKHKEVVLDMMADVLYNPTFPAEEFDKLKRQELADLATDKDDPDAIAANVAMVLRYGKDHPYGEVQTEETTERIAIEQCQKYYETYFKPNISYLIVVGDITPAEARQSAEKYFGRWRRGTVPKPALPMPAKPEKTQVAFVNKTGAVQSVIRVTYPVDLKPDSPDVIKASVMNAILGGYFGDRLTENLREDKGYTYGIGSALSRDPYVGFFSTTNGSVRTEVTDSAVTQILLELDRLRTEPVPQEELTLVKNVMTGSFARSLENPETIAQFALNIARYNLPQDYYQTYLQRLSAVTAEDILAMAKKYLTPENAHILVVGNKEEAAEKLLPFDADGEIDYYDVYGNKLDLGGVSLPAGTTAQSVIESYLEAIGGKDKLAAISDAVTKLSVSIQGQTIDAVVKQKTSGKYLMSMSMNGMTMQEQKFDGKKGAVEAMGQSQAIDRPEDLAALKRQAMPFPELYYAEWEYQLNLQGVDQIDGRNVVAVEIVTPAGETFTDYFDLETHLKVRSVLVQESATEITDTKDYRKVDGILIPFEMSITGLMPIPLVMQVQSVVFNSGLKDSEFEIK